MKILISERQASKLIDNEIDEVISFDNDEKKDDIVKTVQSKSGWFDSMTPELHKLFQHPFYRGREKEMIDMAIRHGITVHDKQYDLKRVFVYDDNNIVGFLVFSYTTKEHEKISNENDDKTLYPIIIYTAVHPEYRNRGLLKMMIEKGKIQKPFLVYTSHGSQPGVWSKFGCHVIKDMEKEHPGTGNKLEFCQ